MLVTTRCVAEVLLGTMAVGVPVRWLIGRCRPLDERAWVEAPFAGIAAVVVPLQALVYCHVPLERSAPFVWAVAALLWLVLCARRQLWASLRQCPRAVFASCAAVYLVHGLGLLTVGARHYVGRGWCDQFNYTCIAEFVSHWDYATPLADVGNHPYLIKGMQLRYDRLGQSVLHGFYALSSGCSTRTLFEPTILLLPPLLLLAVYALGQRLGLSRRYALGCGLAAGLLPAVTLLHLESFLSHCLALPMLFFCLALLDDYDERGDWGTAALAALLLAATANVYTEFLAVLVGAPLLFLALACWRRPRRWVALAAYLVLAASPFLLSPQFAPRGLAIGKRVDFDGLAVVYPWALEVEGIERLWFGDLVTALPASLLPALRPAALGLLVLVAWRWLRFGVERLAARTEPGAAGPPSKALVLNLLVLLALPFLLVARDVQHPYPVYKLLLTVAPLFVLGLAPLGRRDQAGEEAAGPTPAGRLTRLLPVPLLGGVAAVGLVSTLQMVIYSTGPTAAQRLVARFLHPTPPPGLERFFGQVLLDPGVKELADHLERLRGRNIAYYQTDDITGTGFYLNCWISYFGRHNRLWLANSQFNDYTDLATFAPEVAPVLDLDTLPPDTTFLTRKGTVFFQPPGGFKAQRTLWENRSYVLWEPQTPDLAMVASISNPYDLEPRKGTFFWMGEKPTEVRVLASRPGTLRVSAQLRLGPSLPERPTRTVRVATDRGVSQDVVVDEKTESFPVPVRAGLNRITLQVLDKPTLERLPNGDTRALLLGVRGIAVALEPEPSGQGVGGTQAGAE